MDELIPGSDEAHIPLECVGCGLRARTKNIAPLGCRSIFLDHESVEPERELAENLVQIRTIDDVQYVLLDVRMKQTTVELIAKYWNTVKCLHRWKVVG